MSNPFNILNSAWKIHQQEEGVTLTESDRIRVSRILQGLSSDEKKVLNDLVGTVTYFVYPEKRAVATKLQRKGLVSIAWHPQYKINVLKLTSLGKRVAMYSEYEAARRSLAVAVPSTISSGRWKVIAAYGRKRVVFNVDFTTQDIASILRFNNLIESNLSGHFWGDVMDRLGGGVKKVNSLLNRAFRSGRYDWLEGLEVTGFTVRPNKRQIFVELSE